MDFQVSRGSKVKRETSLLWILKVKKETGARWGLQVDKDSQGEEDSTGPWGPLETPAPRGKFSPAHLEKEACQVSKGQRDYWDLSAPQGQVSSEQ